MIITAIHHSRNADFKQLPKFVTFKILEKSFCFHSYLDFAKSLTAIS